MRNASIVLATTVVLALAGVSHAQRPAGITPEMIATALPVEGAPLAVPGPYKVEDRLKAQGQQLCTAQAATDQATGGALGDC